MVDFGWKTKMEISNNKSPRLSNKLQISIPALKPRPAELKSASDSSCFAYEAYLHLPELRKLWSETEFPECKAEPLLKPALAGLEITFRFISIVLSDPRPYSNKLEWTRRLEAIVGSEVEILSLLLLEAEEDEHGTCGGMIPIVDLSSSTRVLSRENSSVEVWKSNDDDRVVMCHVSEESLLPRLAMWTKHEDVWRRIQYQIECQMMRCGSCTLGLGEPNLNGKPSLHYDAICKPSSLHALNKKTSEDDRYFKNYYENQSLYTTHQILESWICVAKQLLKKIRAGIIHRSYKQASNDCWILEKIWELLSQIENLHLLMDPDDFLRLKNQLMIKSTDRESEWFCFRSRGLVDITQSSKDLKHEVPDILGVQVDPTGGPRIQDSAMELYRKKEDFAKIHLLQAMQGVETSVKTFYFRYKQLLGVVMGSLEVRSNAETSDLLSDIISEATYFPSLDGAKTFLGEWWRNHERM